MEYSFERVLHRQGGSLRVSLPKFWCDGKRLTDGDLVLVTIGDDAAVRIVPVRESQSKK
jgi:antitoxin component of MazEF toxin-antitoxin module